jgi:hypothetical protein
MKLVAPCQVCAVTVTMTLPDGITEGEASDLARRLYCVPCGLERARSRCECELCAEQREQGIFHPTERAGFVKKTVTPDGEAGSTRH